MTIEEMVESLSKKINILKLDIDEINRSFEVLRRVMTAEENLELEYKKYKTNKN